MCFAKIGATKAILYFRRQKKNSTAFYVFSLPIWVKFRIWVKFSTGDVHKNYPCDCEFREKRPCKGRRGVNLFLSYIPHLLSGLC
jgi:hypothetical protein